MLFYRGYAIKQWVDWSVETVADSEIAALPTKLRARVVRLLEMVENVGLDQLREPHVRHLEGKRWELRAKSARRDRQGHLHDRDGAACRGSARVRQDIAADAAASISDGQGADETGETMAKLKDLKERFMKDPAFREEYERADEEYALVEAMVRARTAAKLTQSELAARIGTTQSAIVRLEGGRLSPSVRTLRRYAEATGMRLTFGFERTDG